MSSSGKGKGPAAQGSRGSHGGDSSQRDTRRQRSGSASSTGHSMPPPRRPAAGPSSVQVTQSSTQNRLDRRISIASLTGSDVDHSTTAQSRPESRISISTLIESNVQHPTASQSRPESRISISSLTESNVHPSTQHPTQHRPTLQSGRTSAMSINDMITHDSQHPSPQRQSSTMDPLAQTTRELSLSDLVPAWVDRLSQPQQRQQQQHAGPGSQPINPMVAQGPALPSEGHPTMQAPVLVGRASKKWKCNHCKGYNCSGPPAPCQRCLDHGKKDCKFPPGVAIQQSPATGQSRQLDPPESQQSRQLQTRCQPCASIGAHCAPARGDARCQRCKTRRLPVESCIFNPVACRQCTTAKDKRICDRGDPKCSQCVERGFKCTYYQITRPGLQERSSAGASAAGGFSGQAGSSEVRGSGEPIGWINRGGEVHPVFAHPPPGEEPPPAGGHVGWEKVGGFLVHREFLTPAEIGINNKGERATREHPHYRPTGGDMRTDMGGEGEGGRGHKRQGSDPKGGKEPKRPPWGTGPGRGPPSGYT